jgi:hypothetical protein
MCLDLSAAFDTIDHRILLNKLTYQYGLVGNVYQWFKSYLENRTFSVKIGTSFSTGRELRCGCPQGTVLGPILFSLYIQDVNQIILSHGLQYHIYADDIQIYYNYTKGSCNFSILNNCLKDIKEWAERNYLKLNENKTKFVNIRSSRSSLTNYEYIDIPKDVVFSDETKSLGFVIDHSLNFKTQINNVCRRGFAILSNLWRISSKLPNTKLKIQIVHACIISLIDYCNSLYINLPKQEINKLQRLMNGAVRFIYNLRRDPKISITEHLKKCHFLPCGLRIKFKICTLVFRCLKGNAPEYLQNLIKMKPSLPSLRVYDDSTLLHESCYKTSNYMERGFSTAAPKLWNELPRDIRESETEDIFKWRLKTHFFKMF